MTTPGPAGGRLTIVSAAHERRDGLFYLVLRLGDGLGTAVLDWEQKKTLADAGILYLGLDGDDAVAPIRFQIPGEPGHVETLRGFTRDRRIIQLWERYYAANVAGTLTEGPVAVPYD